MDNRKCSGENNTRDTGEYSFSDSFLLRLCGRYKRWIEPTHFLDNEIYYDQGRKVRIATMCADCGNNAPADYKPLWRGPVDQIYSAFKGVLKVIKEEEGKTIRKRR